MDCIDSIAREVESEIVVALTVNWKDWPTEVVDYDVILGIHYLIYMLISITF